MGPMTGDGLWGTLVLDRLGGPLAGSETVAEGLALMVENIRLEEEKGESKRPWSNTREKSNRG